MKLTAKLKAKLLEGAEEGTTYAAASRKAGIDRNTLIRLRHENPGLTEELQEAFERGHERLYEAARSRLDERIAAMKTDPSLYDFPTLRMVMQRYDRRWGAQYREEDVNLTAKVAVEQALEELDAGP